MSALPRKRTFTGCKGMSALCQEQTFANFTNLARGALFVQYLQDTSRLRGASNLRESR
jgi:hypothetical protein